MRTKLLSVLCLPAAVAAQVQVQGEVVTETPLTVRLGTQSRSLPAGTVLVQRGSTSLWALELRERSGGSLCKVASVTAGVPCTLGPPFCWPEGASLFFSNGLFNFGTGCSGVGAQFGPNVVRLEFHTSAAAVGFFHVTAAGRGSTARIDVDLDGDGTFDVTDPQDLAVPVALAPGAPTVVRARLTLGPTPMNGGATVTVRFRTGTPMPRYGPACTPPARPTFKTFAWADAGTLHFDTESPLVTPIPGFLVLGFQRSFVVLPPSNCPLLTDIAVALADSDVRGIASFPYPLSASGARFNAQWLYPYRTGFPVGPWQWATSNAVDVTLR